MDSESCKILILSDYKFYALRVGSKKCDGNNAFIRKCKVEPPFFSRPIDETIDTMCYDLMPLNLLQFNPND